MSAQQKVKEVVDKEFKTFMEACFPDGKLDELPPHQIIGMKDAFYAGMAVSTAALVVTEDIESNFKSLEVVIGDYFGSRSKGTSL